MKEIEREIYSWVLYETPEGTMLLSVLCGSSALYETNVILDFEEKEQYMVAGRVYLEGLAQQIRTNVAAFRHRHISLPSS